MGFFLKLLHRNEVRRRRTTLKSGTALAVPAVPGMPPLIRYKTDEIMQVLRSEP